MDVPLWAWAGFAAFITAALLFDLIKHRSAHVIEFKEALRWSAFWLTLGFGFAGLIFLTYGGTAGAEFTSAYLLEKSLAVDNLFVFALIFAYFKVPAQYQHRVLFLGVLGALVARAVFLAAGVAIVSTFTWVLFLFGAFLLYTAVKMWRDDGEPDLDPGASLPVRLLRRALPVSADYDGQKMLTRRNGVLMATPLLAVLVSIETADIVFAVDSVPAVLAVSDDLFIVYTSNAMAILGLRALYFCLAGLLSRFHYLGSGLALLLGFIGVKMLLEGVHHYVDGFPTIPTPASLVVILLVLGGAILASLKWPPTDAEEQEPGPTAAEERESVGAGT
ncbi:MAG TPA: TerC family protein [Frankiaceae bacterium]|nr:TerC family protein [Frankiaceae bacterium]